MRSPAVRPFMFLLLFGFLLVSRAQAALPNYVIFQGPNAVTFSYNVNVDSSEGTASLVAKPSGQADITVLSLAPGGARVGEATAKNLPYNTQVEFACIHTNAQGAQIRRDVITQTTLGPTAGGQLKFDYTIDGATAGNVLTIDMNGMVVKTGATLTLKNMDVVKPLAGNAFFVEGQIVLNAVTGGPIDINSKNTFSALDNLILRFQEKSAGSTITGAKDCTITAFAAIDVKNMDGGWIVFESQIKGIATLQGDSKTGPDTLGIDSTQGEVDVSDCVIKGVNVECAQSGAATFTNCTLLGNGLSCQDSATLNMENCIINPPMGYCTFDLYSGTGDFSNCQFLNADINITGAKFNFSNCLFAQQVQTTFCEVSFDSCKFRDELKIVPGTGVSASPSISFCSFLGQKAITNTSDSQIIVLHDFFGDPNGPVVNQSPSFLAGGGLLTGKFDLFGEPWIGTGWKVRQVTPDVWLRGLIGGQVALSHSGSYTISAYQNEDFLVSVDVGITDSTVNGVSIYLMYDGAERINPASTFTTLHRDLSEYQGGRAKGYSTAIFILKEPIAGRHTLQAYADLSSITGYDHLGTIKQLSQYGYTLDIQPLSAGAVKMKVVPVKINVSGYDKNTPSIFNAMQGIRTVMQGMSSLTESSLLIKPGAEVAYSGSSYGTTQAEVLDGVAARIDGNWICNYITSFMETKPRFTFAAVSSANINNLGSSYGTKNRSVIFFDEDKPAAAFREMANLTGTPYSTTSVPFTNATAFNQSASPSSSIFSGCNMDRILHQPAGSASVQDITGNNASVFWPSPMSANFINLQLHNAISTTGLSPSKASIKPQSPVTAPMRRIMVSAELNYVAPAGADAGGWTIRPGSLRAMDVTDISKQAYPAPYWSYKYRYTFEFYQKNGSSETLLNSYNVAPADISINEAGVKRGFFMATFDVQDRFDIMRVHSVWESNKLVFEIPSAAAMTSNGVQLPASGTTLARFVPLQWNATGGYSMQAATNQPKQHMVLASTDSGNTWQVLFSMLESTSVTLNTDEMSPGKYLLRILSSDGIRSSKIDVGNLTVANRGPRVGIISPANGAQGVIGTKWTLQADAYDLEDTGAVRSPKWVSDLQGTLGTSKRLRNVVLNPGLHTLTFSCTDSKGLVGSASVQVQVGPTNAVKPQVWMGMK